MITVSGKNYTQLSSCDTSSSGGAWSGPSFTADSSTYKEGLGSLSCILKTNGNNDVTFAPTNPVNLENKHIRLWFLSTHGGVMQTYVNGGIQFFVTGGGNTGYWYVGGRDNYPGGWWNLVCDTSRACDSGTKPADMTQITALGFRLILTGGKNAINTWFDNLTISDGLILKGSVDTGTITCSVNATNGTYTRTAGSFVTDGFRAGMTISPSGFTNAGNNQDRVIASVDSATQITVTDKTDLVTETPGGGDERIQGYADFSDIYTADDATTGGWGIVRRIGGVYFSTGMIEVGDSGDAINTKFQAKSQTVVFEERPTYDSSGSNIGANLYSINVVDGGSAGNTTEFILGSESGGKGIEGCLIRTSSLSQIPKFDVLGNNTNVDNFMLYGSTFLDADSIEFPANGSNVIGLNCNFESCGEVLANTADISYCTFVAANDRGIQLPSASHNVTYCNFVSCPHCVHCPFSDSVEFSGLIFAGSDGVTYYDIEHSVSGLLDISSTNGTNANESYVDETGGGSTTITATKWLRVTCKNESGLAVEGVRVRIEKQSDGSLITAGETDSSGVYQYSSYNYQGDVGVKVIARLKGYKNNAALDTITGNFSIPFTMIRDSAVDLP